MSNFEETIRKGSLSSGKNDPKATDLDYYSKPENYTGASLQSFQRFTTDKNKEERDNKKDEKKRVVKDAKYYFFNRYKHLLKDVIFLEDLLDREQEEESEESECEDDQEGDKASGKVDVGKDGLGKDDRKSNCDGLVTIKEEDDDDDGGDSIRDTPLSFGNLEERSMSPDSYGSRTPSKKKMSTTRTTSGRQSMGIQRVQMDKMAREIRMKEVKESFVRAVKCVKAICRLSASARGKNTGGDMGQMRTFMDIATDETNTEENMKNAGLSFDPTFFKAKKEISISTDTKNILTTPSELRTPDQVQTAMFGLQTLRSYAEYPLHMQEKLAKVAWYEIVAPKRIIIRQGHFAENFYFILSGNAVVTILLKDPKTGASFVKTATVMKKGMSFGELALLHHSKRTATVTSQDTVQLLSIGREDFFDIFMASSDGPDALPDHVKFISNLDFMKDWPIHELVENPQHCLLHFFKRNTTIVANSNNSEWIYIVKSGSCQVLKKLKGVIPNCNFVSKPKLDNDEYSPAKMKAIVFAPKVDTGLRKRKSSSAGDGESNPNENETSDGPESKQGNSSNFSKEKYSQNPTTKKAHFSVENSFNRRKHYDPPKKCKPKKTEPVTPAAVSTKPGPVFVQVSTLKPRDVFGIDSVQFDDDIKRFYTSVSLVSSGAELIMLSKDFYAKHATECVKKHIREAVRPYPDEDVFQDNLQIKEDWVMFKQVILSDLTSRIKEVSNRFKS